MLRLINHFTLQIRKPRQILRCLTTEAEIVNDKEKRLKIIELELDIMRQEGRKMPSKLSKSEWERILDLPSVSQRRKYLTFLFCCEMTSLNQKKKKEERLQLREERLAALREENKDKHIVYGLGQNSMFLKIYETTINLWHNNKLTRAMQFAQKLVIDCSYDEHMSFREADNCAKQLTYTFATNRLHDQPFDLHFCNFDNTTKSGKKLGHSIPTMMNKDFPMNVHKESFTKLFDKERLVYLTPHCRNELVYNHDDIYVVGAMVDKANNEPISLAKAKKLGMRMAKLPLDRYLNWGMGGKSLTINQMLEILLEMKTSNDWNKALEYVPKRKLFRDLDPSHYQKRPYKDNFRRPYNDDSFKRPDDDSYKKPDYTNYKDERKRQITITKNFLNDEDDSNFERPERKTKERKHFDKFMFDIDTWGSKTKNNKR